MLQISHISKGQTYDFCASHIVYQSNWNTHNHFRPKIAKFSKGYEYLHKGYEYFNFGPNFFG